MLFPKVPLNEKLNTASAVRELDIPLRCAYRFGCIDADWT
jgi:hypothetical protein